LYVTTLLGEERFYSGSFSIQYRYLGLMAAPLLATSAQQTFLIRPNLGDLPIRAPGQAYKIVLKRFKVIPIRRF
jgi:hypothetical protein